MPTTDELAADLAATKDSVPTIEELLFSDTIVAWNGATSITAATRFTLMVAPMPVRVLSVACSFEYFNLAASDSSYWTGTLEKGTGPTGFPDIAVRSTRNTGADANGSITARKAWTWDAAAWTDPDLAVGELLAVTWAPTGSVAALGMPVTYTVRYRPL